MGSLLLAGAGLATAAPEPQQILAASDAVRNPSRPYSVVITLTEPDDYQMDGDVMGAGTHLHAVVLPGALTVRVSAAASAA